MIFDKNLGINKEFLNTSMNSMSVIEFFFFRFSKSKVEKNQGRKKIKKGKENSFFFLKEI